MTGCSRDLSLPAEPGRGRIQGSFDTQGYLPADGHDVVLVASDGARSTQRTSGGGLFTFSDVPPGDYYLEANVPGFAAYVRPSIKVKGGDTLELGVMQPFWLAGTPQEGIITGKVRSEADGDTSGGQVEFLLQPTGTRVALSAIGMGGVFVQRVPPGNYKLRASHPLFVMKESEEIQVGAAEQKDLSSAPLTLELNPAVLTGTVRVERDHDTPAPVEGAAVTLGNGATTITRADGTFSIPSLPGGRHTVRVTLPGYHDPLPSRAVELTPGETYAMEEAITVLLDRGTLTGIVELSDGQQATGVTVSLSGTAYSAVASPTATPHRGEFVIAGVPVRAAPYEVVARKSEYARAAQNVTLVANQTVATDVLVLALLQGDFTIDDGDAANAPGYARGTAVKLDLSSFTTATSYRASEDPKFEGVDFQPFTGGALKDFTLSAGEGTHTVHAQYRDATGSQSAVFAATVIVDGTGPAGTFAIEGTLKDGTVSSVRTSTTGVRLVISQAGATQVLAGGATLAACPASGYAALGATTLDHTLTGTGAARTVRLCLRDDAGNVTGPLEQTIAYDGDAPSGCVASLAGKKTDGSEAPPGLTASVSVTVALSGCSEPPAELVLSNSPLTCSATAALSWTAFSASTPHLIGGVEGTNTVHGCVRDAARNVAPLAAPATISLDTTAPSAPLLSLDSGAPYVNGAQVTARGGAIASAAGTASGAVEWALSLDGSFSDWRSYTGANPRDFTFADGDGPQVLYAAFRDAVGNTSATVADSIVFDTTPPTATLSVEGSLRDGTLSTERTWSTAVRVSVSHTGVTHYLLGGEALTSCAVSGYTELPSGAIDHTLGGTGTTRWVNLCVRDAAGNTVGPLTGKIDLDGDAPASCVATLIGRKVDGTASPAEKTATASVSVAFAGCSELPTEVALSNSPLSCSATASLAWTAFASELPHVLAGAEGTNTVYGCVRDATRNVGSVQQDTIALDSTPPSAPLLTLEGGAAYVNQAQYVERGWEYRVSAAGTATGAVEWAVSQGSAFTDWADYATANPRDFTFWPGDGTKTLYALFRDDVGNTSAVAMDSIVFDTVEPDVFSSSLQLSPGGNGYTHSTSVVAQLAGPADADRMKVATAADPTACKPADLLGASAEPYTSNAFLLLLSPSEGTQRACAAVIDAAGNLSGLLEATIVLDTTPPTAPVIITPPKVVNATQANPFVVQTSGAITETHFSHYEQVGGELSSWTSASTWQGTTSFTFNLQESPWLDSGLPNTLQVRAVDLAGNVSATASVVIIKDTREPAPVQMDPLWVSNGDGRATVHWRAGGSPDVVAHNVYYGSSASSFDGVYADQGPSPVRTQANGVLSLSGLINGAQTYVTVRPVDHAGNIGAPSTTVLVEPNIVSPNMLATLSDGWTTEKIDRLGYWSRFVVEGDRLFALAYDSTTGGCEPQMYPTLAVIDLATLVTPIQTGTPLDATPTPQPTALLSMPDAVGCFAVAVPSLGDLELEDRWAFLSAANRLYIIDVLDPDAPSVVANLDFAPNQLGGIEVRGNVLFASGTTGLFALDLAALSDGDAATFPTTADVIGGRSVAGNPGGAFLTRHVYSDTGWSSRHFDASRALDSNPATTWSGTDPSVNGMISQGSGTPVVFGNYAFSLESSRLGVYDLRPLWGGTITAPVFEASFQVGGTGPFSVEGAQAFFVDSASKGVRIADFSTLTSPQDVGFMMTNEYSSGYATATYGQYLFHGDASAMQIAEIATPRSLRRVTSDAYGVPRNTLRPGALVGGGNVLELTDGFPPKAMLPLDGENCFYDEAVLGDIALQAQGKYVRVAHLENSADRDPASSPAPGTDLYLFDLGGPEVTGVALAGNKIVLAEVWPGSGIALEVFSAQPLLDRDPATKLGWGDYLGGLWVTANENSRAQVSMHRGRALVTVDEEGNFGGDNAAKLAAHLDTGLYVVDLRALLDDDDSTSPDANAVQGFVQAADTGFTHSWFRGHRQSVGRGNFAYVASGAGLEVIDISEAMDDLPETKLPTTPVRKLVASLGGFKSLAVYGSYAVAVAQINAVGGSVKSFDVSTPLDARVVSTLPLVRDVQICTPSFAGATSIRTHSGVSIGGSRAYITMLGLNWVMELE